MSVSLTLGMGKRGPFLVLVALLGASGCDPSAKVSGKVSYNGQLLKGGNITFVSTEGKTSVSTQINEDGTYTLPKAPTGKVKICVETASLNPALKMAGTSYSPPAGQKAPEGFSSESPADMGKRFVWIPEHFADSEQSGLTYEVKRGAHNHDLKLEGPVK